MNYALIGTTTLGILLSCLISHRGALRANQKDLVDKAEEESQTEESCSINQEMLI